MTRIKCSNRLRSAVVAVLLAAAAMPFGAGAATTVDYSDLWFNTAEDGWGANVIQQADVLFITLFVYGPTGQPTWYVASQVERRATGSTFSGTLYRTSGPYFASGSWPPSSLQVTPVGTLTFSASQSSAATLAYSVDGVDVTKSIVRQTWRVEDISGSWLGASAGTWSGCGGGRDGYQENAAGFQISQDGTSVQIREEGAGYVCNYTGTYAQSGRLGTIQGGGLCTDGFNQTFTARDVQVSPVALGMQVQFAQSGGSCRFSGRVAGVRRGS